MAVVIILSVPILVLHCLVRSYSFEQRCLVGFWQPDFLEQKGYVLSTVDQVIDWPLKRPLLYPYIQYLLLRLPRFKRRFLRMDALKLRLLLKKRKLLREKRNVALWLVLSEEYAETPRHKRGKYVRPLNWTRVEDGEFHRLIRQMRDIDPERFFKYFRMDPDDYDYILKKVQDKLTPFPTHKFPIGASERLAVTLRYHGLFSNFTYH